MKSSWVARVLAIALVTAAVWGVLSGRLLASHHAKSEVLGLKKVIAFTYCFPKGYDFKQLHSVTLIGPLGAADWKYWSPRGVAVGIGHGWGDLIHSPFDQAVNNLVTQDFGGNPHPVVMIDEFGFDYGGNIDDKSARILRQTKSKRPDLGLAVFDMRGPVPQVLAEAYRDVADLVMMESYVGSSRQYWLPAIQAWSTRKYGIQSKTIFILGLGKGGNPGEDWAQTKEELEQQMRFTRMISPDSPGIGFFGGTPELLANADELSARYLHLPTNGSGLPADVRELAKTFTAHHAQPTLVASPLFVEPNFTEDAKGFAEPKTMRAYVINLGDQDATNVKIRLRNRPNLGGNVFGEAVIPVMPKRSETVAVMPITDLWREWVGQWVLEIDSPGSDIHIFSPTPLTK